MRQLAQTFSFSAAGAPIFDIVMRKRYRAAYRFLMRTQWWSRDRIRALQLSQLQAIVEHAYESSPFYRERLRDAGWRPGAPVSFEWLRTLPVLERADLQERLEEVSTVARWKGDRVTVSRSAGTSSGMPLAVHEDGRSNDRKSAAAQRDASWVGLLPGYRAFDFSATREQVGRRPTLGNRARDFVRRRRVLPGWDLSEAGLAQCVAEAGAYRPDVLHSSPAQLVALANHLRDRDSRLRVKLIYSTGAMLLPNWRALIEDRLQGRVFESYGLSEVGHVAGTCFACGAMHINDENMILEVDPGTSEILITSLTNRATPLLRYRTGDIGSVSEAQGPCGRGLSLLRGLTGRASETLEFSGGRAATNYVISAVMGLNEIPGLDSVRAYQTWQPSADRLHLLVEGGDPDRFPGQTLIDRLQGMFPVPIDLIMVESIPLTPGGKRPFVVRGREYEGPRLATFTPA